MKYLVVILGLSIIALRIIFPNWKIDESTIILFFFISILLIAGSKDIDKLREQISKLKIGDIFEVEFREIANKLDKVENNIEVANKQTENAFYSADGQGSDTNQIENNIVSIARMIERHIINIWFYTQKDKKRPISIVKQINELTNSAILDSDLKDLLLQFWILRNKFIHESKTTLSQKVIILDIGQRIISIISSIEAELRPDLKSSSIENFVESEEMEDK